VSNLFLSLRFSDLILELFCWFVYTFLCFSFDMYWIIWASFNSERYLKSPPVFVDFVLLNFFVFCISLFVLYILLAIVLSVLLKCTTSGYPFGIFKLYLRGYHTLQGDNSLNSVERFDHMMFVCRFQASRWSKPQREKLLFG